METFRHALRRLAKAVVVITSHDGRDRFAMSATAVSELSMDPPSMLISVNRSASIHAALATGSPFAVNILPHDEPDLAARCAGAEKGEARFAAGQWRSAEAGIPILANAQASIVCTNERMIEYGTHTIFIGNVIDVAIAGRPDPLIYLDGRYARIAAAEPNAVQEA